MGAADIVPGVSGGTIALVFGIYERLISSVRAGAAVLGHLLRRDLAGAAERFGISRSDNSESGIDADIAALAQRNAAANVTTATQVVVCDLLSARARHAAGLADNSLDDVICNPPWYDGRSHRLSPHAKKAAAHAVEAGGDIVTPWLRAASAVLRPDGSFTLIHRVERLGDILTASEGRFGAVTIMPVHARPDAAAIRILMRGIKGSRAPMRLAPPLILHEADGTFTARAQAIHRGEAAIGWPG